MRFPRLTPSFAVAVLALVLASGGVGYAAGKVTSAQIKDGTIVGRDVRDGGLAGTDLRNRSIPRTKLYQGCPRGHLRVSGGCVTKAASPPKGFGAAQAVCARRNGRLPTIGELRWLQTQPGFVFGNGNPDPNADTYEFTSNYTTVTPITPIAIERKDFQPVSNTSALIFNFHCVTF